MVRQRIVRVLLIVVSVLVMGGLLLLLMRFLFPFVLLANDGAILKADLDNPYIDTGYENWRTVEIENWGKCMFPNEWRFEENNAVIQITDSQSNIVAFATVIAETGTSFCSREDFLTRVLGFEVTGITTEDNLDFVQIEMSHFGTVTTTTGGVENTYCYLQLQAYESPELFIVFFEDVIPESIVDVVQAIAYSYSFPEEC